MEGDGETTAADEQFEAGLRMIRQGFRQKVSEKNSEIAKLQSAVAERDATISGQQRRIELLEQELARANQALKRVSTDVSKLSAFKQAIISVFDESELSAEASRRVEGKYGGTPGGTPGLSMQSGLGGSPTLGGAGVQFSPVKRRLDDTHGHNGEYGDLLESSIGLSHGGMAGGNSSTPRNQYLSAKRAASPTLSTASTAGESKDFFRVVKSRLQADDFDDFMHNIKSLNAGSQTKSVTIANVRGIFGERHADLVDGFERLLSRKHS